MRLVLSLVIADWILCLQTTVFNTGNLVTFGTRLPLMPAWIWGQSGCILSYFCTYLCCFSSVSTLAVIAFERYAAICHSSHISHRTATIFILLSWLVPLVLALIPFTNHSYGQSISLSSDYGHCSYSFYDGNTKMTTGPLTSIILFPVGLTVINFSYFTIWKKFVGIAKTSHGRKLRPKEHLVLFRCLALTGTFIVCWTPQAVAILYEIATGQPAPVLLCTIGGIFAVMNSGIDSFLLMYFDNRVKSNVRTFFLLSKLRPSEHPTSDPPIATNIQKEATIIPQDHSELRDTQAMNPA
ncbi:hypothetical protein HDU91_002668 [Kappamyces sp. JEL0680]|nr:hypothetical protein HDU91_002668 [Kappamyces sp. JEL0680]